MEHTSNSRRDQFLIEWYKLLWSNVDRSMRGIWNILGTITIVGTIAAAIYMKYIPLPLGAILGFLVLFWAINTTIDLNSWHRRNLIFLTAVEREFFDTNDYGKIIPKKYQEPSAKWITFYKINVWTFIIFTLCFSVYIFLEESPYGLMRYCYWSVFLLGLIISLCNVYIQNKSAKQHKEELFEGRDDKENKQQNAC